MRQRALLVSHPGALRVPKDAVPFSPYRPRSQFTLRRCLGSSSRPWRVAFYETLNCALRRSTDTSTTGGPFLAVHTVCSYHLWGALACSPLSGDTHLAGVRCVLSSNAYSSKGAVRHRPWTIRPRPSRGASGMPRYLLVRPPMCSMLISLPGSRQAPHAGQIQRSRLPHVITSRRSTCIA